MGEEQVKEKSLLRLDLSLEEINNLLSSADDLNAGARNMLKDKRELSLKQMSRKVLDSENPRDAIKAILEIPEKEKLREEIIDLGRISVIILFTRAKEHFSTYEVELVGKVLMRMYPDGLGLGKEPWKTMFFANAKKSFPNNTDAMIEEVEKAGIDKQEYIDKVLRHTLSRVLHGTDEEILANTIFEYRNLLSNISNFYGIDNLDWQEEQRLLRAGDILLKRHFESKKTLTNYKLTRAIKVYRWLRNNDVTKIGDRIKIAEIFQECEVVGRISKKLKYIRIRKIARKLKII